MSNIQSGETWSSIRAKINAIGVAAGDIAANTSAAAASAAAAAQARDAALTASSAAEGFRNTAQSAAATATSAAGTAATQAGNAAASATAAGAARDQSQAALASIQTIVGTPVERRTAVYSGAGTTSALTLPIAVTSKDQVTVVVNGLVLRRDLWNVSGTQLTPVAPMFWPVGTSNIEVQIDHIQLISANSFAAGSAGAPGLSVNGDGDTGLHSPGANRLALVSGGVNRVEAGTSGPVLTGTVTGTAVTQTATDNTAGRLLKVGDFGVGGAVPPDLSDLTVAIMPGIYRIADMATAVGVPSGQTGQATLIATRGSDGRGTFLLSLPVASSPAQRFWHGSRNTASGSINWRRALVEGDFGLGGIAVGSTDFDTISEGGIYFGDSATANRPTGAGNWLVLQMTRLLGTAASQLAVSRGSANMGDIWTRARNDAGVWSPWRMAYSQRNLLGAVSQSGGVPTGAVFERGANANGEFVRMADGTLICTASVLTNTAIATASAAHGFRSDPVTWTFPSAFISAPSVLVTGTWPAWLQGKSASSASYVFGAVQSQTAADRTADLLAVGRWF
jgi:hypothetical protein